MSRKKTTTFDNRIGVAWKRKSKGGKIYFRMLIGDLCKEKYKDYIGPELCLSMWPRDKGPAKERLEYNVFVDTDFMAWVREQEIKKAQQKETPPETEEEEDLPF